MGLNEPELGSGKRKLCIDGGAGWSRRQRQSGWIRVGVQDHLWHAAIGLANSYPGCWKQHIGGILRWELFHRDHDCVSREYGGDWSRCLCRRYCGPTRPPLRHHLGCSSGDDLDDFVGIGDLGYELHPDIFWWQCGGDYLFKGFWFVHDFRLDDVAHRCRNLCRQSNESR